MLAKANSRPITSPDPTARKFEKARPVARPTSGGAAVVWESPRLKRWPSLSGRAASAWPQNTTLRFRPGIDASARSRESNAFRYVEHRRGRTYERRGLDLFQRIVGTISGSRCVLSRRSGHKVERRIAAYDRDDVQYRPCIAEF